MLRMHDARIASARGEKDRLRVVSREHEVTTQYRHAIATSIALKKQRKSTSGAGDDKHDRLSVPSENNSRARHSRDYSPSTRVRTKAPEERTTYRLRQVFVIRRAQLKGIVFVDKCQRNAELAQ